MGGDRGVNLCHSQGCKASNYLSENENQFVSDLENTYVSNQTATLRQFSVFSLLTKETIIPSSAFLDYQNILLFS